MMDADVANTDGVYKTVVEVKSPKVILGLIGAIIGGVISAAAWCAVGYFAGFEIGWLAIFAGAVTGIMAAKFAGRQSYFIGIIAAVVTILAIAAGSAGTYYFQTTKEQANLNTPSAFLDDFTKKLQAEDISVNGYLTTMLATPRDCSLMGLFAFLGLFYGFKMGAGNESDRAARPAKTAGNSPAVQHSQIAMMKPAETTKAPPEKLYSFKPSK